jgi:hypothetical protein
VGPLAVLVQSVRVVWNVDWLDAEVVFVEARVVDSDWHVNWRADDSKAALDHNDDSVAIWGVAADVVVAAINVDVDNIVHNDDCVADANVAIDADWIDLSVAANSSASPRWQLN